MYNGMNRLYSKLKPKQQAIIRERDYVDIISNLLLPMINWNGFPDTVNTKNINLYRMFNGDYGVTEHKGDLISLCADPSGVLDFNGEPINVKMSSAYAPLILDRVNGKNCVVGHNNSMHKPDYAIYKFAYMLSQTDLSMMYNLYWSRLNKAFATDTEETTRNLRKFLDGMKYGEIGVITSSNMLESITGTKPIQELKLTEVENIDKLQYLSNFHQDLVKRLAWLYGVPMNQQSKMAQVNNEEISNSENGSRILLFDMMRCANEFCEKVNKLYGLNTSATLGDAWEMTLRANGVTTDENGIVFNDNEEVNDNEQTENVH